MDTEMLLRRAYALLKKVDYEGDAWNAERFGWLDDVRDVLEKDVDESRPPETNQ